MQRAGAPESHTDAYDGEVAWTGRYTLNAVPFAVASEASANPKGFSVPPAPTTRVCDDSTE